MHYEKAIADLEQIVALISQLRVLTKNGYVRKSCELAVFALNGLIEDLKLDAAEQRNPS